MFKHYLCIIAFYFWVCPVSAQIKSFTVISASDIKTLDNSIQAKKNEGLVLYVLDSLVKTPPLFSAIKDDNFTYKVYIKKGNLFADKIKSDNTVIRKIDSLPNNYKNLFANANRLPTIQYNKNMNRIYVCWSDALHGIKNNDVYLSYSDDTGETWLDRILITFYPNHKQQFMPRFAIDPLTGYLYLMYCDQRNFQSGNMTDIYLAVSRDNGRTFTDHKLNDSSFLWRNDIAMDKYFSLVIKNGSIYPIWVQTNEKKKLIIYSASLNDAILKNTNPDEKIIVDKSVPNIYSAKTTVSFNSLISGKYSAYLYKATDPTFEVKVVDGIKLNEGVNSVVIDFEKLKLKKATYILVFYNKGSANYVWIQEE